MAPKKLYLDNFFAVYFHEETEITLKILWIVSPLEQAHQIHCKVHAMPQQLQQLSSIQNDTGTASCFIFANTSPSSHHLISHQLSKQENLVGSLQPAG